MSEPRTARKPQVIGLFPTPLMHAPGALAPDLAAGIAERVRAGHRETNAHSGQLSHTAMADARSDPLYARAAEAVLPKVAEFGALLFGETLTWSVKEIWVNLLETGGAQAIHNHANSFVSGIVYLTEHHPGTATVFHKSLGGTEFAFVNQNRHTRMGPFNASRWQAPQMQPGDMVLFPSSMLHEVPKNEGAQRITMAFNALPDRLDSWGYTVRFS